MSSRPQTIADCCLLHSCNYIQGKRLVVWILVILVCFFMNVIADLLMLVSELWTKAVHQHNCVTCLPIALNQIPNFACSIRSIQDLILQTIGISAYLNFWPAIGIAG